MTGQRAELEAKPQTADAEQDNQQEFAVVAGEQRRADRQIGDGEQQAAGGRNSRSGLRREPPDKLPGQAEMRRPMAPG
jgi:hypothetical protein